MNHKIYFSYVRSFIRYCALIIIRMPNLVTSLHERDLLVGWWAAQKNARMHLKQNKAVGTNLLHHKVGTNVNCMHWFKYRIYPKSVNPEWQSPKITIRDGGSTALHYLHCWHCLHCLYYSKCFSLLKQWHVCPYILLGKVRTQLEMVDAHYKQKVGWMGDGWYPLDCYDY